jgi:rfaE bifunctional protein kinase chain/domain
MDLSRLEYLLGRFSGARLLVYGDYFLDSYLMLDRSLSETSIETGLEAYQMTEAHHFPGAAGTVAANLRALGVQVTALGVCGDDGNGYTLRKKLNGLKVDLRGLVEAPGYATPTYTKPMMCEPDGRFHELNRMDIKHRDPLPPALEERLAERMRSLLAEADGMLVIDQVAERNCGVVTDRLRAALCDLAAANPAKLIMADSRANLGLFDGVILKSNLGEAIRATGETQAAGESQADCAERCGQILTARCHKPVITTLGEDGMFVTLGPGRAGLHIPADAVRGPIDIVGAGDSVNASVGAALCSGASLQEAAQIGALVASIVIQQIGVTGTATPAQVIDHFLSSGKAN